MLNWLAASALLTFVTLLIDWNLGSIGTSHFKFSPFLTQTVTIYWNLTTLQPWQVLLTEMYWRCQNQGTYSIKHRLNLSGQRWVLSVGAGLTTSKTWKISMHSNLMITLISTATRTGLWPTNTCFIVLRLRPPFSTVTQQASLTSA